MELGGVDIVVNNAGAINKAPLSGTSEEDWDRIMQVNLKAPFLISKYLVPEMKKIRKGGRLIFNSSVGAKLPDPMGSAYNASKAGLLGFVRCLAAELGADGITVNAICPGWVDTPMASRLHEEMYPVDSESSFDEFFDDSMRANMLGARITPNNIAEFAVYLASDKGRFITAQAINVCARNMPVLIPWNIESATHAKGPVRKTISVQTAHCRTYFCMFLPLDRPPSCHPPVWPRHVVQPVLRQSLCPISLHWDIHQH